MKNKKLPKISVGQKVTIPWWEAPPGVSKAKRVANLTGTIQRIDGAYHYIKIDNNPKYDVLELYPNEFEIIDET